MTDEREKDYRDDLHIWKKIGENTAVPVKPIDSKVWSYICDAYPFFVIDGVPVPFLYDNGLFVLDTRKALRGHVQDCVFPELQTFTVTERIYKGLLSLTNVQTSYNEILQAHAPHWINFHDCVFDPKTMSSLPHSPDYRFINQIPFDCPTLEELNSAELGLDESDPFQAWLNDVIGQDEQQMLYEYIGYSMTSSDTSMQRFLIILGPGGTGKSTLARIVSRIIGKDNIANVELSEMGERFKGSGLLGKLLNVGNEADSIKKGDSTALKRATGQDPILCEFKGKDGFRFTSTARHLYTCNQLPMITDEVTNAWYRRAMILKMDKIPDKLIPDLESQLWTPDSIKGFLARSVLALHSVYERGELFEAESSKQETRAWRCYNDGVQAFLESETIADPEARTDRKRVYDAFDNFRCREGYPRETPQGFYKKLSEKGYVVDFKTGGYKHIVGFKLKPFTIADEGSIINLS